MLRTTWWCSRRRIETFRETLPVSEHLQSEILQNLLSHTSLQIYFFPIKTELS